MSEASFDNLSRSTRHVTILRLFLILLEWNSTIAAVAQRRSVMVSTTPVTTTKDLEINNETYLSLQNICHENSVRCNHFLAFSSRFFVQQINRFSLWNCYKISSLWRFDLNKNSWRVHFFNEIYKISKLHAILQDAAGYTQEYYKRGLVYAEMLPCDFNRPFAGHITRNGFCWYLKLFNLSLFICKNVEKENSCYWLWNFSLFNYFCCEKNGQFLRKRI